MKKRMIVLALCLAVASPLFAQKKEEERIDNSATVLRALLRGDKGLPVHVLDQADCVVIFPSVKKIAIGVGGSYGRGVLVCRTGPNMDGPWGTPAMYKLDQASIGVQLGSTATDFVLTVMNRKGAEQILNGKTKLGTNAAAAAGPTGAQATSYNASAMNVEGIVCRRVPRRCVDGQRRRCQQISVWQSHRGKGYRRGRPGCFRSSEASG
jgi:lipid-binding SYLF domain-containing protein